ncbi:MAG TPA: hypothetical protein VFD39_11040 [Trueperaceae bacterium]|nr:hypothetical protein [Trueperaceae bacterium]
MRTRTAPRYPLIAFVAATLLVLAACSTPTPSPPDEGLELEGTWLVTPASGTEYGAGGTTTLEFGAATSGSAAFLSRSDANDITTCERHVYAILSENVVLLDEQYYIAEAADADTLLLDNGTDSLTLTRVAGTPLVTPCGAASVTELDTYAAGNGNFTSLSSFDGRLYFNIDDPSESIVSFDTASGTFGAPRVYSQSVSGGIHNWVVAARSDDLFYGHCACGGSESADAFNLATNTSIVSVETGTDLGNEIGVRYGYFDGATVVIGGRSRVDSGINVLLTLDADTLALISQRQILPEASIDDVALLNGQLIALVDGNLVLVGADGRADATVELSGQTPFLAGLATIGSSAYVLAESNDDESLIYEVTLP